MITISISVLPELVLVRVSRWGSGARYPVQLAAATMPIVEGESELARVERGAAVAARECHASRFNEW